MRKKTNFWIYPLLIMGVFLVLVSSCKKDKVPVLTTTAVTDITQTTAISGGNITSDGGSTVTASGVCWSTNENPTTSNSHTTDGTGTGSFISNIAGLTENTTYYARAYATNSAGTNYGNEVSFTTTSANPCAGVTAPPGYGIVESTGRCWLDRNLGASQVATSSTDTAAYGDLFQWGRAADGHQIRTSGTTTTLSSINTPVHGNFITTASSPYDWRSPQTANLWQGVGGVNNPCPAGWRLPTEAEWNAERLSWSSYDAVGAFASLLKLPMAGSRSYSNGSLNSVGNSGFYWSSTVSSTYSHGLTFHSNAASIPIGYRAVGESVRCLKGN